MSEHDSTFESATLRQYDLLKTLAGIDYRPLNLSKREASDIISSLLAVKDSMGAEHMPQAGQDEYDEVQQRRAEESGESDVPAEAQDAADAGKPKRKPRKGKAKASEGDGDTEADEVSDPKAAEQPAEAKAPTLEDGIVEIVKRRRDEVLDGIELGGAVERKVLRIERPDLPAVELDGHQHTQFETLVEVMNQRDHVLAVGPAGTGKTSSMKLAAKALSLDWTYWACNPRVTASALLGFMDANGNYVRTQFRDAYEHGKVFILDEMDNAAPDLLVALNGAIENGHAAFPDGIVERHADFVVTGTANTYGKGANRVYSGRQQLDGATLDRFLVLDWGYDEVLERKLAPVDDWTDYVHAIRKVVEEHAIREVVSMRASIKGGKYLNLGWSWTKVEDTLLLRGWSADARSKIEPVRQRFAKQAEAHPGKEA